MNRVVHVPQPDPPTVYTVNMPVHLQIKGVPETIRIVSATKGEESGTVLEIKNQDEVIGSFNRDQVIGWWVTKA